MGPIAGTFRKSGGLFTKRGRFVEVGANAVAGLLRFLLFDTGYGRGMLL
jgi:hypothetical protein